MHENGMILEVNESPKKVGSWIILAIQHVLAMFVACITVPLIVFSGYINVSGASLAQTMIAPTIVSAGIGTLIYIILTKMKFHSFFFERNCDNSRFLRLFCRLFRLISKISIFIA